MSEIVLNSKSHDSIGIKLGRKTMPPKK